MKALTLRHSWVFAICHMGKRIENRSWRPPRWMIGKRLAIHGGKQPERRLELQSIKNIGMDLLSRHGLPDGFDDVTLSNVIMPGIVAVATVASVVTKSDDPWFDGSGFGWVLTDVLVLSSPIPCRGSQGLWEIPAVEMSMINAEMEVLNR